jgi:hypothetical protein
MRTIRNLIGLALGGAIAILPEISLAAPPADASAPPIVTATAPSKSQIYGVILGDGVTMTGSRGILSVTHPLTGVYCIEPSSSILRAAVAGGTLYPQLTIVEINTSADIAMVYLSHPLGCPSTSYLPILTFNAANGNEYDTQFVISFN